MPSNPLVNKLLAFGACRRGNVAMMFGIVVVPLITAVGLAIDYSQASASYSKMVACADSAVLAAVSKKGMESDAATAKAAILTWFNATCSASTISGVVVTALTPTVTDTAGARTAKLDFTANRTNSFLNVAGFDKSDIKGSVSSTSARATHIDFYALLDDSPSMGLAATTEGQSLMKALTKNMPKVYQKNCAFACHEVGLSNDTYKVARNNDVKLRIDVLREAWKNLITDAQTLSAGNINNFRFATYTFNTTVTQRQALTSSFPDAFKSAETIDLMPLDASGSGPGSTYTDYVLDLIASNAPTAGDGSSADASKKYLIFVTDGVQDFKNTSAPAGHETKTITPARCLALKQKGIQVAVIYTTYLPMPDKDDYNLLVKPFESQIGPSLQSCASPGYYWEAAQEDDIRKAFAEVLKKALARARLQS